MATCKQIRNNVENYLSQSLTPGQTKVVEKHIKECPSCEARIHNHKEIDRVLRFLGNNARDSIPQSLRNIKPPSKTSV